MRVSSTSAAPSEWKNTYKAWGRGLPHAIHKTTGSIPQADIDIAHKRFADFIERMDAEHRRRPRAAGSDAP